VGASAKKKPFLKREQVACISFMVSQFEMI